MLKKLSGIKKTFKANPAGVKRSSGIVKAPKASNIVGKPAKKLARGF